MKISELTGTALDWVVAKCKSQEVLLWNNNSADNSYRVVLPFRKSEYPTIYSPSTNWSHGGPIIERERICVDYMINGDWIAVSRKTEKMESGDTPLIAAMRCFVASELGEQVEIPKELEH
jgi:hypothetical protein